MRTTTLLTGLFLAINTIAASPFAGTWCLTSPTGGAVWMSVAIDNNTPIVKTMWEIGGVEPVKSASFDNNTLVIERDYDHWYMRTSGMRRDILGTDTLHATIDGDTMNITLNRQLKDGTTLPPQKMVGTRQSPMPPRPDITSLKFGPPKNLFDGATLNGWRLTNPEDNNAWSVRDNILFNNPQLEDGPNPKQFGNLRTVEEFEDFRLTLEVRLPQRGNSGIFLRGRYEVQVTDSFGQKPSWGGIGGVYSRIVPLENAAKPAGEWQRFDIILADRHVTVRLNDKLVIDNQPLEGCTGGALFSDDLKPGPIYFQGDHTSIEYRHIKLHPRLK